MHFPALATDYDGTLAQDGFVAPPLIAALERLRTSGCLIFLVTGREVEDLIKIFPRCDVFEAVIAENGGVLYDPKHQTIKSLHDPPPQMLVQELRARGVSPLSIGRVLIATREPNEGVVLDSIKVLGLELKIVFNKGAVMVLPPGVNKATGLAAALKKANLSPKSCVGVGDAENDHAFIEFCGYGVAVQNAIDSLKKKAAYVTRQPNGRGVLELIERLMAAPSGNHPSMFNVPDGTVPEPGASHERQRV